MRNNILVFILISFAFVSCERKKTSKREIKIFKPVNNTIPVDYNESDNLIYLKELQSDERLYNFFYEMYFDDTLIKKYRRYYSELIKIESDTSRIQNSLIKWIKSKIKQPDNIRIYFAKYTWTQCEPSTFTFIEIEHKNNSSYYEFDVSSTKPDITINNCKKGYLSNIFDTLVNYSNIKLNVEKPLPRVFNEINGIFISHVCKYEKDDITTAQFLKYSDSRLLQVRCISERLRSLFDLKKSGLDLDSIYTIEKRQTDSLEQVIANYRTIFKE